MTRASRLLLALVLIAASVAPTPGFAQSYPNRPVRLVVPFPPGGPADALGRALADQLNRMWGQPVILENRGGAGGNLGAEVVARAAPDGYTLLLNASSHVINASLYEKLPYDPIKDFTPVSEVASYMLVLVVHPSLPATSVKDFVAGANGKPDGLSVANAGLGTPLVEVMIPTLNEADNLRWLHKFVRGSWEPPPLRLKGKLLISCSPVRISPDLLFSVSGTDPGCR